MADVSFSQFDSASFPTLEESIANSLINPFLLDNFSDKYRTNIDGLPVLFNEPSNILQSLIWLLTPSLLTETMPQNEIFMPERTSKRLYGSHDFWYMPMLVNDCMCASEYKFTTMLYLPSSSLPDVEVFLNSVKGAVNIYDEDKSTIYR